MSQVLLSYELDMEPESIWLTVTPSPVTKTSIVYVQELGDFITRKNYYTRRSGLPSYLIKYTLSGEGILEYAEQTHKVHSGQVFWIDCQNPQFYYTSPEVKNWRVVWVHFYGPVSTRYYDLFLQQNNGGNVVTLPPTNNATSAMNSLMALYQTGESSLVSDISASGILTSLMVECILATTTRRESFGIPDCVMQARSFLLENYNERITLDDLASKYSINKFYFQKLFKKYTGFTPNEYIILTRLNKAKEYLRTTDHPISTIASEVGVENASHFINLFKKHEGITPHIYRQSWYGD